MRTKIFRWIAPIFLCLPMLAHAGGEALFGLTFGMTVDQVKKVSPTLSFTKNDGVFAWYKATRMPKELSNAESYTLAFAEGKLVRVGVVTTDITGDPYGSDGKQKFSDLRASLVEKYGQPSTELQQVGLSLFKEPDEFYQCLRYEGCGLWSAIFKADGKSIILKLYGQKRGTGWIGLWAESNPEYEQAREINNRKAKASDKDAL